MCSTFLPINGVLSACPPMLHRAEVFPRWILTLVAAWSLASSPHTDPIKDAAQGQGSNPTGRAVISYFRVVLKNKKKRPSHIIYMINMFRKLELNCF